ncbi:L-glyceraldehyde 3-phosphate reductase [Arhodomonas sp. AD133]|uniref:L-glyceraldehyde 3-phosphate reductase n=1 Tax=Arhodomonas sp. AD133 TaxID=3415009 RepID=UPI003EB99CD9
MVYLADEARYERMPYAHCGRSGLQLPRISLGLWQNFAGDKPFNEIREMLCYAFDQGVTHFDLANNYGPPPGAAEENVGRLLKRELAPYREELVISTKAGYRMQPGPYGFGGSRKYLLGSLDASLTRLGLDYVDIFYSHRFDADTPLEETMGALASAVQQGKALYVGISSYSARKTAEAATLLREMGVPCLIHQPSYSMLNRWIEDDGLLDVLAEEGMGCIAFSPLAQGLLTDKYLDGVPEDSRVKTGKAFSESFLTPENLENVRALNTIAQRRGQTLAQMAIAWVLRDPRVTSTIIGASRVAQIADSLKALERLDFSEEELAEIDRYATDGGLNVWQASSDAG